ncbi:protein LURP-one-related 5-like [Lycium ferocissimum]|uniref:protein LURP-one-related 5-like n=1 Tax=Lycium ferocissimum TaxID=112874 RepID=UPI0028162172|nr:protein LURP-one-related 5-like [Lycium ferocissimum]
MSCPIVNERFCFKEEMNLTIHKSSLFYPGDGFIAYNPGGEIVFRVESYCPASRSKDELILMDSTGASLVTLQRKKPSLHQRWEGFLGEKNEGQEPIFTIHKSSIIGRYDIVAQVHNTDPIQEFKIEGSYVQRSCKILYNNNPRITESGSEEEETKVVVAEIERKMDSDAKVVLGKDVFLLCLKAGIDGAFIMALVLVLDQMEGHDYKESGDMVNFTFGH